MTSVSAFSTPLSSSRYLMCMMLPSFPSSVKFRLTDSEIFRIISALWITLHTSLIETSSDISKRFKLLMCFFRISFCFSRTCSVELMFLRSSSVVFR